MNANEVASLRAEIDELKLQRQELRQLNAYREVEAAKYMDQAKTAHTKVEQLTKAMEDMKVREVESMEQKKKLGEEMAKLKAEYFKVNNENETRKGVDDYMRKREKELEGRLETLEGSYRSSQLENESLKERLQKAQGQAKEYQKRCKDLEAKYKPKVRADYPSQTFRLILSLAEGKQTAPVLLRR